jgi:hypothetical protein
MAEGRVVQSLTFRRRALALAVLVAACLAAMLGIAAGRAMASYSAVVKDGTLQLNGNAASD